MAIFADLHFHSSFSDGRFSPEQLVKILKNAGIFAGALTDHDTLSGLDEFFAAAARYDLIAISGVEISCIHDEKQVHLLAYGFDRKNQKLNDTLNSLNRRRKERAGKIIEKLNETGLNIDPKDFFMHYSGPYWGRPDLAKYLIKIGAVESFQAAFARYLGNDRDAYVPNTGLELSDAVQLVRSAGGIAVLAHPALYDDLFELESWGNLDFDGIELYHPQQRSNIYKKRIKRLAASLGWAISGGTDFHGASAYRAMGLSRLETETFREKLDKGKN